MTDCIFCKIIAGQIPAHIVHEDERFMAILDAFPLTRGHVLIIPKAHAQDIFDLPKETAAAIMPLAQKIAGRMRAVLQCGGINILQNNGASAGQAVMHYHLHIIPRYAEDPANGEVLKFGKPKDTSPEEQAALAARLK